MQSTIMLLSNKTIGSHVKNAKYMVTMRQIQIESNSKNQTMPVCAEIHADHLANPFQTTETGPTNSST